MTTADEHIEFYDDEDDPNALPDDLKTVWRWLIKQTARTGAVMDIAIALGDEGQHEYLMVLVNMQFDMLYGLFDEAEERAEWGAT
jgi:hypothetical protein